LKRITCVMLDMGGVLTQAQRPEKVDEMMRLLDLPRSRADFLRAYSAERNEYDRGVIDGGEYWSRVAASLGGSVPGGRLPGLVQADLESWFNMRPTMLDFLGGAKARVGRILLLSNIHFDGARFIREGPGSEWASRFDELVLSCEHRLLKPQREIYDLALDMAGAEASETLFVDDNEANVVGARAAGLSSFRFTDEEDFAAALARDYELRL